MIDQILEYYRRYKPRKYGWTGNYESWEDAKAKCVGYDDLKILEKVRKSTLKVKNGEFAWEVDGVNHEQIYHSWSLLAQLMLSAAQNNGNLKLIDFGGSLGTTYFQNRKYLNKLKKVTWSIIEQVHFVKTGNDEIAFEALDFFESIDSAIQKNGEYDTFLINCVLPYIEEPYQLLEQIKRYPFKTIIIESTYFNYKSEDRICIQQVDPMFYDSSYPCRFLNYDKVKNLFLDQYEVFEEYDTGIVLYLDNKTIKYKSLVFKLKE